MGPVGIVDEDIAKVREATDIVSLISQYAALRRVGQRFTGLCPFHNEKTPSFSVDPASGLYHCFGCKASGDAITFVREKEQTDFVGAVEFLANRAGVTLHYTDHNEGETRRRRAKLYDELERACDWYHERLRTAPDAASARSYLRSRGFTSEDVTNFRIGWAPDGWDEMLRALRIPADEATACGLGFINRAGRAQDFFRARILFPIIDERSRVIGFGGRKMPDAEGAKYQNSRDNDVYHKSRALYGLNWAKTEAVERNEIVVCEGYTDVIGFHRAGVARAVATCGTALTEDHVKLIKRFAKRIVLAYDADEAGQAAADRVYAWERTHEIEVAVAELPDGSDPGELALVDPARLSAAVDEARPFLAFRIDRVLKGANLGSAEGRSRAADSALAVVAEHPEPFVRDQYVMEIADVCRIDVDLLRESLRSGTYARRATVTTAGGGSGGTRGDDSGGDPGPVDPLTGAHPVSRGRHDGPPSADGSDRSFDRHSAGGRRARAEDRGRRAGRRSRDNAVELESLKLFINSPEHIEPFLVPQMFGDPVVRDAYAAVARSDDIVSAREAASPEAAELIARLAVEEMVADPTDVLVRLATEVGRSVMADLEAQARSSADPLAFAESITWLKLSLDALRSSRVEGEKLAQLLVWLGQRRQESDGG